LLPDEPEVLSLQSLMLLQDSRRMARVDESGALVILADQDRGLWDAGEIQQGLELLARARRLGRTGPYLLQAEIAAQHATAPAVDETDWARIVEVYDQLIAIHPSPVARLNRAVAVFEEYGAAEGLAAMEDLGGDLDEYQPFHVARSEMLRELGADAEAQLALKRALELTSNEAERRFLEKKTG
jgi:RNA polymerase sigma-70 factor (ECF subfamily)